MWRAAPSLRTLHGQLEAADDGVQLLRRAGELLGGRGDLLGRRARLLRAGGDLFGGGGGLFGDRGDFGDVVLGALGFGADLVHGGGDVVDATGDVGDGEADRLEGLTRLFDRGDAVRGALVALFDDA